MGKPIVFAGPSLTQLPDSELAELDRRVEMRPPAQRGDVLKALAASPDTIVLIDGYYFDVPSVSHKELLYAVDSGVRVIGAASMGALRAAELCSCGMIGLGDVFDWYFTERIDGDDEVAVLHMPEDADFRPITIALVELRYALMKCVKCGYVSSDSASEMISRIKAMSFRERSPELVYAVARDTIGSVTARKIGELLSTEPGIKAKDARNAIYTATSTTGRKGEIRRQDTIFLTYFLQRYLQVRESGGSSSQRDNPLLLHAWYAAMLLHPSAPEFVRSLRERFLMYSAAVRCNLSDKSGVVDQVHDQLKKICHEEWSSNDLPSQEVRNEAEVHGLALIAYEEFGDLTNACTALADSHRIRCGCAYSTFMALLDNQAELFPTWHLIRGFAFSTIKKAAARFAGNASERSFAFDVQMSGRSPSRERMIELACKIWECEASDVMQAARKRALYGIDLYNSLELFAKTTYFDDSHIKPVKEFGRLPLSYVVASPWTNVPTQDAVGM